MFAMPTIDVSDRHPTIQDFAQWFDYDHLPEHLKPFSQQCYDLAANMISDLPDSPQLSLGLQKLLEAKDCFVRASVQHAQAIATAADLQEERKTAIRDSAARMERVSPENPMGVELPGDGE